MYSRVYATRFVGALVPTAALFVGGMFWTPRGPICSPPRLPSRPPRGPSLPAAASVVDFAFAEQVRVARLHARRLHAARRAARAEGQLR